MKRLKIMLLSFALLAIVGGALAFKAKFSTYQYCTAAYNEGQGCPALCDAITLPDGFTTQNGITICYTVPTSTDGEFIERCYTTKPEGGTTFLPCNTFTLLTED